MNDLRINPFNIDLKVIMLKIIPSNYILGRNLFKSRNQIHIILNEEICNLVNMRL